MTKSVGLFQKTTKIEAKQAGSRAGAAVMRRCVGGSSMLGSDGWAAVRDIVDLAAIH